MPEHEAGAAAAAAQAAARELYRLTLTPRNSPPGAQAPDPQDLSPAGRAEIIARALYTLDYLAAAVKELAASGEFSGTPRDRLHAGAGQVQAALPQMWAGMTALGSGPPPRVPPYMRDFPEPQLTGAGLAAGAAVSRARGTEPERRPAQPGQAAGRPRTR